MIIRSLLTNMNPFNSTEEIRQWIERRNREVEVKVERIPFSEMKMWHSEDDGSIRHDSGRFFLLLVLMSIPTMEISVIGVSQSYFSQKLDILVY